MVDGTADQGRVTVGFDLGDRQSRYCFLDAQGEVMEEGSIPMTEGGISHRFRSLEACRIALEVGTCSAWVTELLQGYGHEVYVANPRQVKLISHSDRKDDRTDAETLARVARLDPKLLRPIRHRGPKARGHLAVVRSRDVLVRTRTVLVNHVRGMVKTFGGRLPRCSTSSFAEKVREHIPAGMKRQLSPVLTVIRDLGGKIRTYDKNIQNLAEKKHPVALHLAEVPGVGVLTGLAFVLTIEDPSRFRKSREVGPYLGLRPRRYDSGHKVSQLGITKAGDGLLRRLLVGSAHHILGPFGRDTSLRRWGLTLAERGGKNAKKRAVVAVARKLAVLLHRLWVTGEVYEPLRNAAPLPAMAGATK